MKQTFASLIALALLRIAPVSSLAAGPQTETYDTGTYSEIFYTNASPVFSFSSLGILGTRAIQPANTMYNINYLRKGPLNLSTSGASLDMSTMFKVVKPTSTNLGVATLHIGACKDQSVTAFISGGQSGAISYMISPKSLIDTGNGFHFDSDMHLSVYNGSTSAGFGYGVFGSFILKSNNWYKASIHVTRINSASLQILGRIDDYGPTGAAYVGNVDYNDTGTISGSASYPFTPFTSDTTMYPAMHGMSSGGLKTVDQTVITGQLSPDLAADISLVAKLDFATQAGLRYFIHASPDLTNWTAIEGPINGGGLLTRYYPLSGTARFFRVTLE